MFELTTGADALGLQSLANTAELYRYGRRRHSRYGSYRVNSCLVTANHSLNGLNVLNILNNFGW